MISNPFRRMAPFAFLAVLSGFFFTDCVLAQFIDVQSRTVTSTADLDVQTQISLSTGLFDFATDSGDPAGTSASAVQNTNLNLTSGFGFEFSGLGRATAEKNQANLLSTVVNSVTTFTITFSTDVEAMASMVGTWEVVDESLLYLSAVNYELINVSTLDVVWTQSYLSTDSGSFNESTLIDPGLYAFTIEGLVDGAMLATSDVPALAEWNISAMSVEAVPEPSSVLLVLLGGFALLFRRPRRDVSV